MLLKRFIFFKPKIAFVLKKIQQHYPLIVILNLYYFITLYFYCKKYSGISYRLRFFGETIPRSFVSNFHPAVFGADTVHSPRRYSRPARFFHQPPSVRGPAKYPSVWLSGKHKGISKVDKVTG